MNGPASEPIPFGISADSGQLLNSIPSEALQAFLEAEGANASPHRDAVRSRGMAGAAFPVMGDVDPGDLRQAGWGVMFGASVGSDVKDALRPLLEHRRAQTGNLFKTFEGPEGYLAGDSAVKWLARRNLSLAVVDPEQGVPYYLLLVASPEEIPFEFQYGLDLWWGIGRLWLPTPADYVAYAESIVRYETDAQVTTARQMVLFAPRHDFDRPTQLFSEQVATPLVEGTAPIGARQRFRVSPFIGETATKAALRKVLTGDIPGGRPSMLFSGSHGMEFNPEDGRQEAQQGALVCQDWQGYGAIDASHWFTGDDVPSDAKVHGLIHFLFACYGAGTPMLDNFDRLGDAPRAVAPRPMLSRLPQRLLAHPGGGALAVLGHVERAWAYSFQSPRGGPQVQSFRDVIGRILRGDRIGQATDNFNLRWAGLTTDLAEILEDVRKGVPFDRDQLKNAWVARDDARNYMILGDPAVRLRVADMPELQ